MNYDFSFLKLEKCWFSELRENFEVELFRGDYFTTIRKTLVSEIGAVLVL